MVRIKEDQGPRIQDAQNWAARQRFPLIKQKCPILWRLSYVISYRTTKPCQEGQEEEDEDLSARRTRANPSRLASSQPTEKWTNRAWMAGIFAGDAAVVFAFAVVSSANKINATVLAIV